MTLGHGPFYARGGLGVLTGIPGSVDDRDVRTKTGDGIGTPRDMSPERHCQLPVGIPRAKLPRDRGDIAASTPARYPGSMIMVDWDTLRRKGWRRHGKAYTFPKRPREFELTMHLKGKRVERIVAQDPKNGQDAEVYDLHRGFRRSEAKHLFSGQVCSRIEDAIEALHNEYILTM